LQSEDVLVKVEGLVDHAFALKVILGACAASMESRAWLSMAVMLQSTTIMSIHELLEKKYYSGAKGLPTPCA
jgi:hypothetical protein